MGIKFNNIAMKLITDLGLNYTFFIQGGLFLLSYFFLSLLFNAYYKAYVERCGLVEGQDLKNQDIHEEVGSIKEQYSVKLKELNQQVQDIFSTEKNSVEKKVQGLVARAEGEAEQLLLKSQTSINEQLQTEKKKLPASTKELSQVITQKVLS